MSRIIVAPRDEHFFFTQEDGLGGAVRRVLILQCTGQSCRMKGLPELPF